MSKNFEIDAALFTKANHYKKTTPTGAKSNESGRQVTDNKVKSHNLIKCHKCGIIRLVKRNCTVKFSEANVARGNDEREGRTQMGEIL